MAVKNEKEGATPTISGSTGAAIKEANKQEDIYQPLPESGTGLNGGLAK